MDLNQRSIVAIDPGKVTGWAEIRLGEFHSGQADMFEILEWVDAAINFGFFPTIVCEDFIYNAATAKKTRQTWSTEGIGVLRYLARKADVSFHLQPPVDAKRFATDDKLKTMGWYRPTKGGHANDAARHLLLYCVKNNLIDPRDLIKET